ncbi:MAG: hypothetical protein JO112_04320, partial [Planctomycetes bacterium]|nr:hypothetical protein [Planctomycetota bacterium]
TVLRAEDISTILNTAAGVAGGPDRVINALRLEGVMQVQLDVVVAFVSRSAMRRMSFDFIQRGRTHTISSMLGGGASQVGPLGTIPSAGVGGENLFLGIIHNNEDFLAFLTALRDENLAKILSQPRVLAMSGRPASILSGGEQAIPEPGGLGVIGVRFEPFGTSLSVLPIVMGNGKIHLEIDPQISQLNQAFGTTIQGTSVPGRQTQHVHTVVEMEDGQTLAIGGLVEHTVQGSTTKVPVLGDLPFLGVFFSSKTYNDSETELLVVVTPHVVDPMSCAQAPKIFPGQETRNPDDFELFLEGILEAPRGQREVFPNHRYEAAYLNGPTAGAFPCYGGGGVSPAVEGPPALEPAVPPPAPNNGLHGEAHPAPAEMPPAQAHAGPTLLAAPKHTATLLPSANWSQVNPPPSGTGTTGAGTSQGSRPGADLGPSGFDN